MKYELAKLFGDVDDKFITAAKPEAQKPVEVTIKKSSPLKLLAAASCAAVILTGGVLAVNALHNRGMSELDNREPAFISSASTESDGKTLNRYNEEQIYYEGEIYSVTESSLKLKTNKNYYPNYKADTLVGLRRSSENVVEVVTVLKNLYDVPLGVRIDDAGSFVMIEFAPDADVPKPDDKIKSENAKTSEFVLQPGEVHYHKNSFSGEYGESMGRLTYGFVMPFPDVTPGFESLRFVNYFDLL